MLSRRAFVLGAFGTLVFHHRPGHRPKPTPTPTPTPTSSPSRFYTTSGLYNAEGLY